MALLSTLRYWLTPNGSDDPHAPYLTHYELRDADGEVYKEADVPVVFFEDGPAIAKATLLNRAERAQRWRVKKTDR